MDETDKHGLVSSREIHKCGVTMVGRTWHSSGLLFIIVMICCWCVFCDHADEPKPVLLPEGEALTRTCSNGQSWCYRPLEDDHDTCTPLMHSGRIEGIAVERNSTSWTFEVTKAVKSKHTGWYVCGDVRIQVIVVEQITLVEGESFNRTCRQSGQSWCHTKPGTDGCTSLLFNKIPDLDVSENNSLTISNAQQAHGGRYTCGEDDLLINVVQSETSEPQTWKTTTEYAEEGVSSGENQGTHVLVVNRKLLWFLVVLPFILLVLLARYIYRKYTRQHEDEVAKNSPPMDDV